MRKQPMSGGQIDDASAAKDPADAARHLPGFEQLLARQTASAADGARESIEERVASKATEVVMREAALRRMRESQAASV